MTFVVPFDHKHLQISGVPLIRDGALQISAWSFELGLCVCQADKELTVFRQSDSLKVEALFAPMKSKLPAKALFPVWDQHTLLKRDGKIDYISLLNFEFITVVC